MAVEEVPVKFKTSDGREFENKTEASRHEDLIKAREEYEAARRRFGNALARTHRTADGELFDFGHWGDYYYVIPDWFGVPELSTVSFYGWGYEFDDRDGFVINKREGERYTSYKISDLYVDKRKAEAALLVAQEKWLLEKARQIEELRSRLERKGEE